MQINLRDIEIYFSNSAPTNEGEAGGADECPFVANTLQEILAANCQNYAAKSLFEGFQ